MAALTSPMTKPAALYTVFAWQMMMVRSSISTILSEADRAHFINAELESNSKEVLPSTETEIRILAGLGRSVRSDLSAVIRHNCAGAVFQIVYSLFENLVKSLGLEPGPAMSCGPETNTEPLSRILWASRNAFAHGNEWKRQGPKHPRAQDSYAILTTLGFQSPASVNLFDVYNLISGGSSDAFIQSVLAAGKAASEQAIIASIPTPTAQSQSSGGLLQVALNFLLLAIIHLYREINISENGIPVIMAFQYGSGADARTIPVAEGSIKNPIRIIQTMRSGAIKRLSADAARPYNEVDARLKAWYAELDVLFAMNVEDPGYFDYLSDLCKSADDLYALMRDLPDPREVLEKERGVASMAAAQQLMAEIMTDGGFTPLAFREVPIDIVNARSTASSSDV